MRKLNHKTLTATAFFLMASCAYAQNSDSAAYLNPSLPAEKRAADLVHRMTVEEKVSQLTNQSRAIERRENTTGGWPGVNAWFRNFLISRSERGYHCNNTRRSKEPQRVPRVRVGHLGPGVAVRFRQGASCVAFTGAEHDTIGRGGGDRTHDLRLKRPLLYH